MIKTIKILSFTRLLFILLSITAFFAFSYFNSNNFSTHQLLNSNLHGFLFSSHLNDHVKSQDTHKDTIDDHVHRHRHSENEQEHSHKHLSIISFSDIVINNMPNISFLPIEIHSSVHLTVSENSYDSYILEILKPPILTS